MFGILFAAILLALPAHAAESRPAAVRGVGIDPVPGAMLPLDARVIAEDGKSQPLGAYFDGRRPVVLVLNYYGCPMLCGLLLNNVRDSLEKLGWRPGEQYRILSLSIDPQENAELAAAKKKSILGAAHSAVFRAGAERDWHFLVGENGSEKRIADSVGYRYKWDAEEAQWAHGSAVFLVSPSGKLSRVLFGLDFPPADLRLGLLEAGEGKVGTFAETLLLFCYHYDPKESKYAVLASRLVSLGGCLTVLALVGAWFFWFLRDRRSDAMRL